jgi:hypothetical protein
MLRLSGALRYRKENDMLSTSRVMLLIAGGILYAMASCILAPTTVLGQPAAKIISIEGATTQYQVIDQDGKVVEVEVPRRSLSAIQTNSLAQNEKTVSTTVASVIPQADPPQTFLVKVVTRQGQIVTLEMPAAALDGMQTGDMLTLQVP